MSTPSTGRSPPSTERALPAARSSGTGPRQPPRSRARRPRTGSAAASGSRGAAATSTRGRAVTPERLRATQISSAGHLRAHSARHVGVVLVRLAHRRAPAARSAARARSRSRAARRSTRRARGGTRPRPPATRTGASRTAAAAAISLGRLLVGRSRGSTSVELQRKTSRPPGRSSRAASGIQRYGSTQIDAPYSETTRSKLSSGSPVSAASASTSGNSIPVSAIIRRAVSSCAGRDVDADRPRPALREPRGEVRGAAPELDDVEARDVAEHVELGLVDRPDAPRDLVERPVRRRALSFVYSRFALGPERGVLRARVDSDEPIGEPEPDLALGRLGRVRAVNEVVRHRERELAAQRAGVAPRPGSSRRSSARHVATAPSPSSTNASVGTR